MMDADEGGSLRSKRGRAMRRKSALWSERSSWMLHWQEISQFQQPRLGRFFVQDRNKGGKRHQNIIDNTAVRSSAVLAAGMMSGMTSPARPWFRGGLEDKDLSEYAPVKLWLHRVTQTMLAIFAGSNTYRALHSGYEELGLFGTWCDLLEDDFDNVVHHHALTVGEYALAVDAKGYVNTMMREFQMTVGQIVSKFGRNNCSQTVRNLYDRGNFDAWVDVYHLIEPRTERDPRYQDAMNMPFRSAYFEPGKDDWDKFLRESGYELFPALAPRWAVTGADTYGWAPGMECLGDVKQLQHQQTRKGQGIDYMTNPPLQVPVGYKGAQSARLPGGVFYVDQNAASAGVRSAYEVQLNLQHLLLDIQDVRDRIKQSYYADMFLMLAQDRTGQMTATEVAERHEEKLLMLGPVLERLHNELLSPMIDWTFDRMRRAGMFNTPYLTPPPELQGQDLKIEFISVLAQAQRAVNVSGMDRLVGTVATMSKLWPEARHKLNVLQMIDDYADMYGVNPATVVPDEEVQEKMAADAQAAQQAQMAEALPAMAQAGKAMGETDGDNVRSVMAGLTGYDTVSPSVPM